MSGCIRPWQIETSQEFHVAVSSVDVPVDFWEVHWTVQIVEQGVWKDKYYGGYGTSFSFLYNSSSQSFEAGAMSGVWTPEHDMPCDAMAAATDAASWLASRLYVESTEGGVVSKPYSTADEVSSYAASGGVGYQEIVWFITDTLVSAFDCVVSNYVTLRRCFL